MMSKNLFRKWARQLAILMVFLGAQGLMAGQASAITPSISPGTDHTCALNSAGGVLCWGWQAIGNGNNARQTFPVPVQGLSSGVVQISSGAYHTCALTQAGAALCWGDNSFGQIGDGSTGGASLTPVPVTGLSSGVVQISAGSNYTCALMNTNAVRCWGYNFFGQLGNGTQTDSNVPVPLAGLALGTGVTVAYIMTDHKLSCAMTTANEVWCWGRVTFLNASLINPVTATKVWSGASAAMLGWNRLCVLIGASGMLCYNDLTPFVTVKNPAGLVISSIAGGAESFHFCELAGGGAPYCWGANTFGELGNQTRTDSLTVPVQPLGLTSGVIDIEVGYQHTCAITQTGSVYCWGLNTDGQVGVGTHGLHNPVFDSDNNWYTVPQQTLGVGGVGKLNLLTTLSSQTITFGALADQTLGAAPFTVSATVSSGLPVAFSTTTNLVCTVSGTAVTLVAQGTCTIAADQAGSGSYSPAPQVTQSFQVTASLTAQTITFGALSDQTLGAAPFTVSATASSGLPVAFSTTTNLVCTISGTTVTLVAQGTCTIAADQAGNGSYSPVPQVRQSFTVNAGSSSPQASLIVGWNLLGNSVNAPLAVGNAFPIAPTTTNVSTVWKWLVANSQWAFYSPALADGGVSYAQGKGYIPLIEIKGGEGFWVNAKAAFTLQLPTATAITSTTFADQLSGSNSLAVGWSLIATGDNPTPKSFVNSIALSTPTVGSAATSLTTLWAWDSALSNWYFYAPSLDNAGTLNSYITNKNYLDFSAKGKVLDQTTGFWVNHP